MLLVNGILDAGRIAMFKKILLSALIFCTSTLTSYDFNGVHYIASFKKCDREKLNDVAYLLVALIGAIDASGATILSYRVEKFDGGGVTAAFILSESHASIHTYPEHGSCFIDLFTCGSHCNWKPFHEIIKAYLNADEGELEIIPRS